MTSTNMTPATPSISEKEEAEGSRDIVERELARADRKAAERDQGQRTLGERTLPASDPSNDPEWARHTKQYFERDVMQDEGQPKAT